jgi:hypothetical protein
LDSDQTGNTTHEGAEGVENSLKKLPNHESLCFDGVMTDSGGGFVREPKKTALQAKGLCHSSSLVTNCTCHNIQLTGTVPMKHLFQKGSIGIRSLRQMLFLTYEFQSTLGRPLARELLGTLNDKYKMELDDNELTKWQTNKKELLVMKPDNSRWLYTAFAVDWIKNNHDNWIKLADKFLETSKHMPTERDIVRNLKSLLNEPEILVNLALTAGFFQSYFFQHFKFLQGVDPNIGKPGFLSFHIFVRVFLMREDLDCLLRYKTEKHYEMEKFESRVNVMPQDKQEAQHKKAQDFFQFLRRELLKMFDWWIDTRLFFLAAFGEAPTGKLVARYLLSTEVITKVNTMSLLLPTESITYESPKHGCIIDMRKLCGFLVDCIDREKLIEFKKSYLFASCRHHFKTVAAAGSNIWDRTQPAMQAPCRSILIQYGGLPSNTQMIKRGNKNHNICASHSREGRAVNARFTCRSVLVDITSTTTVDKKREASSGKAHTKSIFL